MDTSVQLCGRPVQLEVTPPAVAALNRRAAPLRVDMELRFGCMVRKQLRFEDGARDNDITALNGKLALCFRPVTARVCTVGALSETDAHPEGYLLEQPGRLAPKWLRIDYRRGAWIGDFGFARS